MADMQNPLADGPDPNRPTLMQAEQPQHSIEEQLQALFKQSQGLQQELQRPVEESVRSKMTGSLKDLNTYVDSQYQQKYGGGGKTGTGLRFLTDLLRGNGRPTLKEQSDAAAERDYKAAMTEVTQQVIAEKSAKAQQLQAIQEQARVLGPAWQAERKLKLEQANRDRIADIMASAKDENGKALHTAKQVAEARLGRNFSNFTPRILTTDVLGADAEGIPTIDGKPRDPTTHYRMESADSPEGAVLIARGNPQTTTRVIPLAAAQQVFPTAKSATGWVAIKYDSQNKPVGEPQEAAPSPAYAPTTTERAVTIGNDVVKVPMRTQKEVPGTAPGRGVATPTTPIAPPPSPLSRILPPANGPATPTTPPILPPALGRVLGRSPAAVRRDEENPLTGTAQGVLETTAPVMAQVNRAMAMLEPHKNENKLQDRDTWERLKYKFGIKPGDSELISNEELGKVIGASRVLKGSSRALPSLEIAMTHLPDPWKDTYALQYSKLQNLKKNLEDIEKDAKLYGTKYPGRVPSAPGTAPNVNPPAMEDLDKKYGFGKVK